MQWEEPVFLPLAATILGVVILMNPSWCSIVDGMHGGAANGK
jgi:hypothetical protein